MSAQAVRSPSVDSSADYNTAHRDKHWAVPIRPDHLTNKIML
jgi:hypothetical protein